MNTPEININLKPSIQFISILCLVILGTFAIILSETMSYGIKLIEFLLTIFYGAYIAWRYGFLKHQRSIIKLFYDKNGWHIREVSGETKAITLLGDSTLSSWLCVLRYSIANSRIKNSCLIFYDSIDQDMYRKLLVALRFFKLHGVSA